MKYLYTIIAFIFLVSCSENKEIDTVREIDLINLVKIENVYYEGLSQEGFTGKAIKKWPNGRLKERYTFKNGIVNGLYESFYESGRIFESYFLSGPYDVDIDDYGFSDIQWGDGEWNMFYKNGQLMTRAIVKNGTLNGYSVNYYENGQLEFKGLYIDGKREGEFNFFDDDGKLERSVFYESGIPVEK